MKKIHSKLKSMRDVSTHYCPGCGHGIIHRLICEVIDQMKIRAKTIGIAPVGCAVIAYDYWDFDVCEAAHGRTPSVATGIKRMKPDNLVFSYQGDGDLAAIGTAEIIHTANRSENITVIFVNNGVYGMTNGQMAPTTLLGQRTQTTPAGREIERDGYPLKVSELLSVLPGPRYIERVSVHSPAHVLKTKKAIKKAFDLQMGGQGFTLIEILSACPTCWGMDTQEAVDWIENNMMDYFPLGVFKDR